jgi:hypothetical protein
LAKDLDQFEKKWLCFNSQRLAKGEIRDKNAFGLIKTLLYLTMQVFSQGCSRTSAEGYE